MAGLTQRAVITGKFAGGTCPVELDATDPANLVLGHVPVPGGNGIPFFECDLHRGQRIEKNRASRKLEMR